MPQNKAVKRMSDLIFGVFMIFLSAAAAVLIAFVCINFAFNAPDRFADRGLRQKNTPPASSAVFPESGDTSGMRFSTQFSLVSGDSLEAVAHVHFVANPL